MAKETSVNAKIAYIFIFSVKSEYKDSADEVNTLQKTSSSFIGLPKRSYRIILYYRLIEKVAYSLTWIQVGRINSIYAILCAYPVGNIYEVVVVSLWSEKIEYPNARRICILKYTVAHRLAAAVHQDTELLTKMRNKNILIHLHIIYIILFK